MYKILKRIIFSFFLIYSFNLIGVNFNIILPINFFTLCSLIIFDAPGMIVLIIVKFLYF